MKEPENENPAIFDDCIRLIDRSINGLELTSEFVSLPQLIKIIELQKELRQMVGRGLRSIVLQELANDGFQPFNIGLNDEWWNISVKKIEKPDSNVKTKWWNFKPKK